MLALFFVCAYLTNEGKRRLFLHRHWSCSGKIKRLRVGGWCWGFLLSSSSLPQYISSTLYHTGRFRKLIICNFFIVNIETLKGEGILWPNPLPCYCNHSSHPQLQYFLWSLSSNPSLILQFYATFPIRPHNSPMLPSKMHSCTLPKNLPYPLFYNRIDRPTTLGSKNWCKNQQFPANIVGLTLSLGEREGERGVVGE